MATFDEYEKNDPDFVNDLKKSDYCTRKIAAWLRKKGYDAVPKPIHIRPEASAMAGYSDGGDIFIGDKRIESKQRLINFTSKEDFPYPTIIVDVAHCWDDASPKPYAYFLANKSMSCCLVVRGSLSPSWKKTTRWDRLKKRNRSFYECPVELAEFRLLDVTDDEVKSIPSNL